MAFDGPKAGTSSITNEFERVIRPLRLILSAAVGVLVAYSVVVEGAAIGVDVLALVLLLALANLLWNVIPRSSSISAVTAGTQALLDAVLALLAVAIVDGNSSPLAWLLLMLPVIGVAARHGMVGALFTWVGVSVAYLLLLISIPSAELTRAAGFRLGIEQSIAVVAVAVPTVILGARVRRAYNNTRAALMVAERTRRQLLLTSRAAQRMSVATKPDAVVDVALDTVLSLGYDRADVCELTAGQWQLLAAAGKGGHVAPTALGLLDRAKAAAASGAQGQAETEPFDRQELHDLGYEHGVAFVVSDGNIELAIRAFVDERATARPDAVEALQTLSEHVLGGLANTLTTVRLTSWASKLHHRANHDELTGLPNRAHLLAALDDAVGSRAAGLEKAGSENAGSEIAVLFLDLNGFKEVNDVHGHEAGDMVLQVVAERLGSLVEGQEFVARLGGDEFVMLTMGRSRTALVELADRISEVTAKPIVIEDHPLSVGASVGIAEADEDSSPTGLLRAADKAMYEAKIIARRSGRSEHQFRSRADDERDRSVHNQAGDPQPSDR